MDKDAQALLKLTVLDWDLTNSKRPIAEVELPIANSEAGQVVTRRLDLKENGGLNAVQAFFVNNLPKSVGDHTVGVEVHGRVTRGGACAQAQIQHALH